MAGRTRGKRASATALPKPRREKYKGHEIVYPSDGRRKRLFIDGRPVLYGQVGDQYYLNVYAYDRAKTLEEVIRRYINYKDKVSQNSNRQ